LEQASLTEVPSIRNDDEDMAQLYYTSGTTGRPKGVILTHRNNAAHADGTIRELKLTQDDRWLHVSPMFHLADAWAVWALTKVGATHVMIPGFDEKPVLDTIVKHKVTLSNFIPTMLNLLVNFPGIHDYDLSSLRLVMSGGAPIAKEVVKKILAIFGCDYIQTYGLTETSPFLTMSILKEGMKSLPFEQKLQFMITTGRPFATVQLKVVKKNGEEVISDGEDVGEIIAKGETVTPGYWGLPEQTTERIIDGWLHTHDLAVRNPEGYVTIVDRMDDVIITGGENVFSVEVEDTLYACPGVLEAAVIGMPDPVWGEKVTAIVVKKEGERCEAQDIIRFCKQHMAPYKAPKEVIFSDELPKTGSAKICKYKLRQKYGTKARKNG
jgi:acyl-CoA synthetase (AMP-forming)/AMP-acid ligase II